MRRTNIYLTDEQHRTLHRLGVERRQPVAELVRQAVDAWMEMNGVRMIEEDAWGERFDHLLGRRREVADQANWSTDNVEADVTEAVRELRASSPRRP